MLSSSLAAEKYSENYFNIYLLNGPEWLTSAHEYALLKTAYTQVTQTSPFFSSPRHVWNTTFITCKSGKTLFHQFSPREKDMP